MLIMVVYKNSLFGRHNFSVNLNILYKIKVFKKVYFSLLWLFTENLCKTCNAHEGSVFTKLQRFAILWNPILSSQMQKKIVKIMSHKSSPTKIKLLLKISRASLVAQWLRICLLMQGTRVRALVWEDPTCHGAAGPVSHNCWACASGACAPRREGPR